MKKCKTCRFWIENKKKYDSLSSWGECSYLSRGLNKTGSNLSVMCNKKKTIDGNKLIITREVFGCPNHPDNQPLYVKQFSGI